MKKALMIILAAALCFSIVACNNDAEEQPSSAPGGDAQGVAEIEEEPPVAAEETPAQATEFTVSPTTGLPGNTAYRPVIVQIDNEKSGRPQYGIQDADIVYESMIEGADTRLTALFNDNLPTQVGPVRSARVYHQLMASEWDAIFIHDGGPFVAGFTDSYIYAYENGDTFQVRIDGTKRQEDDVLWKESIEIAWANVQAAVDEYDYERTLRDPLFKFDENVDYSDAPDVAQVNVPFISKPTHVSYEYDAEKDKLIRYRYGEPFEDAETGEAVEVQNLIIEYAERNELPDEGGRITMGVLGSGEAEFYVGGKHLTGTWQKNGVLHPTIYTLDDGSELVLKPGNTWIEIQPDDKDVITTYADGSTYPAGSSIF